MNTNAKAGSLEAAATPLCDAERTEAAQWADKVRKTGLRLNGNAPFVLDIASPFDLVTASLWHDGARWRMDWHLHDCHASDNYPTLSAALTGVATAYAETLTFWEV